MQTWLASKSRSGAQGWPGTYCDDGTFWHAGTLGLISFGAGIGGTDSLPGHATFPLVQRARPIFLEQARQGSIR
ncbi:hypothetical protein SCOR_19635 [Sulfidibacter corallicola]